MSFNLRLSEDEPLTHELKLHVALPQQLVTGFWIVGAAQVPSNTGDESHGVL